ncbi:MAG TPA: hypothetical protein VII11_12625 [Bacteroidota bacterium]
MHHRMFGNAVEEEMRASRIRKRALAKGESSALLRKLRETLSKATHSESISSLDDGEQYICTLCDLPVKPCLYKPSINCLTKVRTNTQLDFLSQAYRNAQNGTYGFCVKCHEPLTRRQLNKNPLQELCSSCNAKLSKAKNERVRLSV